ncbi:MAG: hypothetical protein IT486_05100 [Gammaproteobacteria bacterium]|nr:hypothetical protein [Gammaproteobacteria bacterium]
MLNNNQFLVLTAAGALAIVLAAVNGFLFTANRALQQQASERAQFIQQSIALEGLYREMVQGLADRGLRTRDEQVRDLLAAEGITLNFDAAPAPGARP